MLKAVNATQKQLDIVKLHEQAKRNLEEEIQNYKEEAQKQRKIIFQLEKERDRYINEASDLTQKVSHPLWWREWGEHLAFFLIVTFLIGTLLQRPFIQISACGSREDLRGMMLTVSKLSQSWSWTKLWNGQGLG